MGTGAYMTLHNRTGYDLSCSLSNTVCMYDNGKEGSHLERFNAHLANNTSLNDVYIEAKAGIFTGCASKQSCFTLNFKGKVFGDGEIGSLTINLGSNSFNTSVVHNTNKAVIKAEIHKGNQYHITINVVAMPLAVDLVNSFLWSNREVLEKALKLPPQENSQFKVSAAALTGLTTLVCTEASVAGSFENGTLLKGIFEADQLFSHCELTVKAIKLTVGTGIILRNPKLLLEGSMTVSDKGFQILATKISLKGGNVIIPGAGIIPDVILTALFQWFVLLIDTSEIQKLILGLINNLIPNIPVSTSLKGGDKIDTCRLDG